MMKSSAIVINLRLSGEKTKPRTILACASILDLLYSASVSNKKTVPKLLATAMNLPFGL